MNPRYRGVTQKEVKTATPSKGVDIKVIAGKVGKVEGPVGDLVVDADYVDITLKPDVEWEHPLKKSHTALAYVFEGAGSYGDASKNDVDAETLVMFGSGDSVVSKAGKNGMRFLLVSGQPIGEPIAWRGPIVMNTWDEIEVAFQEYWDGTFLSHVRPSGTL
jgi:redox-sensitive bicupin YhaK (pirin superfamily)